VFDFHFLVFILTVVSLIAVPGPDMICVVGRALTGGPRASLFASLGIAAGYAALSFLIAGGVQIVFEVWPPLFLALQYIGIAYLLFLAYKLISSAATSAITRGTQSSSGRDIFLSGVATSALNPKGLLFYFSIMPQFYNPEKYIFWQYALLYGLATSFLCFLLYFLSGLIAIYGSERLLTSDVQRQWLTRLAGLVLLCVVGTLAWTISGKPGSASP
jgi:threonine/homoserine/homoserine lactone efflux protein